MDIEIARLVRMSLAFHNLNKGAETHLGLSLVQYYVLATVRDMPGCSPQDLAEAVGMHPSTLTQSLKRLQRKKVVFVAEDPKDSRKKIISMTREGREYLEHFTGGIKDLLKKDTYSNRMKEVF